MFRFLHTSPCLLPSKPSALSMALAAQSTRVRNGSAEIEDLAMGNIPWRTGRGCVKTVRLGIWRRGLRRVLEEVV